MLRRRDLNPLTSKLPTELVNEVALYLDAKSIAAFRIMSKAVAGRIDNAFSKRFETTKCRLAHDCEDTQRVKELGKSKYADKVKHIEWIETEPGLFSSLGREEDIRDPSVAKIDEYQRLFEKRLQFILSPQRFGNLTSLTLCGEYDLREECLAGPERCEGELLLEFLSIELEPGVSWITVFQHLRRSKTLQKFRFEKVQNVFFDWDGNGELDDGSRLPSIIEQKGLKGALRKMIGCYRYVRSEDQVEEAEESEL
ncbi:hypothetical protein BC567DRAFT_263396 [Phyllosticta citribraziliensis]